jgi:hypothetical protein
MSQVLLEAIVIRSKQKVQIISAFFRRTLSASLEKEK